MMLRFSELEAILSSDEIFNRRHQDSMEESIVATRSDNSVIGKVNITKVNEKSQLHINFPRKRLRAEFYVAVDDTYMSQFYLKDPGDNYWRLATTIEWYDDFYGCDTVKIQSYSSMSGEFEMGSLNNQFLSIAYGTDTSSIELITEMAQAIKKDYKIKEVITYRELIDRLMDDNVISRLDKQNRLVLDSIIESHKGKVPSLVIHPEGSYDPYYDTIDIMYPYGYDSENMQLKWYYRTKIDYSRAYGTVKVRVIPEPVVKRDDDDLGSEVIMHDSVPISKSPIDEESANLLYEYYYAIEKLGWLEEKK